MQTGTMGESDNFCFWFLKQPLLCFRIRRKCCRKLRITRLFSRSRGCVHAFLMRMHAHFRQLQFFHFDYITIFSFCAKNKSFSENILCTLHGVSVHLRVHTFLC